MVSRTEATLVAAMALQLSSLSICGADDNRPSQTAVRASVENSLPYLAERGQWWIEKKECMSCHRVAFTAWSHVAADAAGVEVDEGKVNDWIDWCHENLFEPFPEKDQKYPGEKTIERNLSGAAQMLYVVSRWESSKEQVKYGRQILKKLSEGHAEDGRWHPRGQLPGQKRPLDETAQVVTMWNSLAVNDYLHSLRKHGVGQKVQVANRMLSQASEFLKDTKCAESSTEWLALRFAWEHKLGNVERSVQFLDRLRAEQNTDGGWSWLRSADESDVLATAQVVYLLCDGDKSPGRELERAVEYLLSQQKENGAWKVKGTKEDAKERNTETASYWGSAWAAIALSRYLQISQETTTVQKYSL